MMMTMRSLQHALADGLDEKVDVQHRHERLLLRVRRPAVPALCRTHQVDLESVSEVELPSRCSAGGAPRVGAARLGVLDIHARQPCTPLWREPGVTRDSTNCQAMERCERRWRRPRSWKKRSWAIEGGGESSRQFWKEPVSRATGCFPFSAPGLELPPPPQSQRPR